MSDVKSQPPMDRASILNRAHHAQSLFDDGRRRFAVKALCRDRYRCGPLYAGPPTDLTDDEIIEAAYGTGRAGVYWRVWLFEATSRAELMQAIAAHCAVDQDSFYRVWRTLLSSLDKAPAGLDYFADVQWLANNPSTSCFIPSSLEEAIAVRPKSFLAPASPTSGVPGRPTSLHLVLMKLAERGQAGVTLPTCKAESEWLSAWLAKEHPEMPRAKTKTLQNSIASQYRTIPKSVSK